MTETVPETDDLIARLHSFDYFGRSREEQDAADALCREAATALEAAQARIAELEAERDRAIAGWSASQDREIDAYGCVSAARREALEEAAGLHIEIADLIGAQAGSSIHSALCEYYNRIRALMENTND